MTGDRFPVRGRSWEAVKEEMQEARRGDLPWYSERMFLGGSYYASPDVVAVANEAYNLYINFNELFAKSMFPSISHYEDQIVGGLLEMLNAPPGAAGSITSGGTESIMMAMKTAREWALENRPEARVPEVVLPYSAHPSFDKAAHFLGIQAIRVAVGPDFRADVAEMGRAINENTIMLVGSAPSFPLGVTDSIVEIAALGQDNELWVHVDACHGGFVLPFARKLGYSVPGFDFEVPGVTSISVDFHKLGYSNKGVSGLLLRDAAMESFQHFSFDDWPGGLFTTSSILGSKSGGGVASAWAMLHYLGEEGYLKIVSQILRTRTRFVEGIRSIEGLEVWGEPDAYVVAFGSGTLDIFAVDRGMAERDWIAGRVSEPPSIQLFFNMAHQSVVDDYLRDLAEVTAAVKAGKLQATDQDAVYST